MKKLLLVLGFLLACAQAHAQKIDVYQPFGALATITPGTGVATALGVNIGSNGSILLNGGQVSGNIVVGSSGTTALNSLAYGSNGGISLSGGGTPSYGGCFWSDVDTCSPINIRGRERAFFGNAVLMSDTSATCCSATFLGTNSTTTAPIYLARDAQLLSMSDRGTIGLSGMSRFSDNTSGRATIGTAGYGQNNATTGTSPTAYGGYYQCDLESVTSGATNPLCWGIEIDSVNYGTNVTGDPFGVGAGANNLWLAAGGAQSPTNPSNFALGIAANGTTFNEGIMIKNGALTADSNSNTVAIALSKGDGLKWYLSAGTPAGIITSNAAGQIQLGGLDQPAPISQTIHAQSVLTGTSNTAGATMFVDGSQGTGSAGGGTISVRTAPAGGSGSGQNALVQALGISGAGIVQVSSSNIVSTMSGATARFAVKDNASGFGNSAAIFSYQASNVAPATLFLGLSRSGTLNTAAAVVNNDHLGATIFDGNDGTSFVSSSAIIASASGTISAGIVPGVLSFQTANTSGSLTEAIKIDSSQNITLDKLTSAGTQCVQASSAGLLSGTACDPGYVSVVSVGATGNTATIPGTCSISASSAALACPSATFTADDVGKPILVHGMGTAGAAVQTTIATFVDSHDVILTASATISVPQSAILSLAVATPQSGAGSYVPGDTITLAGGTATTTGQVTVLTTQVASATAGSNGSGCTNGTYNVTGTTGRGTLFQANITVTSNVPVVNNIIANQNGSYIINPTTLTSEPITGVAGCGTQPTLSIKMGVLTVLYTNAGLYSGSLPGSFTQASTSGSGTGATFTPTFQANGTNTIYGTDDTAGVASAISQATTNNQCVYFPAGNYWLASSATSIALANLCLQGTGAAPYQSPYTKSLSTIFISNASTAQFTVGHAVNIDNLVFMYPAQDSSVPTPLTFPALFEAALGGMGTVNFSNLALVNPYIAFFSAAADGTMGRVAFKGVHAYCVQYCLEMLNGASDIISFDSSSWFTPGYYQDIGLFSPGSYLATYTAANGEFFHLDTTNGAYQSLDGLILNSTFVYGYQFGVRVLGSPTLLNVSSFNGAMFDNTPTAFSLEGGACVVTTNFSGGWVYGINKFALQNGTQNAINFNSSCATTSDISFSGFNINFALGGGYFIGGSGALVANINGGQIKAWGQTTINTNSRAALQVNNGSADVYDNGVTHFGFQVPALAHANHGVVVNTANSVKITGKFKNVYQVLLANGSAGKVSISGSQSTGSQFAGPVNNMTSAGLYFDDASNDWDKPATPTLTSGWGSGATQGLLNTNNSGSVTIGSTPTTSLLLTFGLGAGASGSGVQRRVPSCNATDVTSGIQLPPKAASNTSVTFGGVVTAGDVLTYACQF